MSEEKQIDIPALVKEMHEACAALEAAEKSESIARSISTTARNRLNEAQKAIDAALSTMRRRAPRDSDWGQARSLERVRETA